VSTGSEPRYVMIGTPIGSVRTPPLLEAFLAAQGAPARVEARQVEAEDLAAFMAEARADPSVRGLMVTMPHKRAIRPFLDGESQVARAAGSVNAVKRVGDGFIGAQFDGIGLRSALLAEGVDLAASTVRLAGLGGAGLAIAQALLAGGCGRLLVRESDGARLADVLPRLGSGVGVVDEGAVPDADVLVNATPLGMGAGDGSPFSREAVARAAIVADIVADPNATRLAAMARDAGVRLVTGRMMVEHQIAPIGRWLLSQDIRQES